MKKSFSLTLLCCLIFLINLPAQTPSHKAHTLDIAIPEAKADSFAHAMFSNAPIVFDGKVIKATGYRAADGKIYTTRIVQISKVRRGKLQLGTIEVQNRYGYLSKNPYDPCPHYDDRISEGFPASHIGEVSAPNGWCRGDNGHMYTFFCSPSQIASYYPDRTNNKRVQLYHEMHSMINYLPTSMNWNKYYGIIAFKDEADFETYMGKYGLSPKQKIDKKKKKKVKKVN